MSGPRNRFLKNRAFSLVEVILAVGILSVALLTIVALHSSLYSRRGEISSLREIFDSASSLEIYLQQNAGYEQVRGWVADGPKHLIHVGSGMVEEELSGVVPTATGWRDSANGTALTTETDRRLVLAVLEAEEPPAPPPNVPGAVVVRASLYPLPSPEFEPSAATPPALVTLLTVLR